MLGSPNCTLGCVGTSWSKTDRFYLLFRVVLAVEEEEWDGEEEEEEKGNESVSVK